MGNRYFATGECTGCESKSSLARKLKTQGLDVFERAYAMNLPTLGHWTLEFDRDSEDEATIEGTTLGFTELERDALTVSSALAGAGIRHWIELRDDVQTPLGYLHYMWPDQDAT